MYQESKLTTLRPRSQFLIITDQTIPKGYQEETRFKGQCNDERLIYNNTDIITKEYKNEKG